MLARIARRLHSHFQPKIPIDVRHAELSVIASADDDTGPSQRLIDLSLATAKAAAPISLRHVSERMPAPPYYPDVWPGEHYKLLAGLIEVMNPSLVIEIGTFTGLSALAMKSARKLVTFDIVQWDRFSDTCLRKDDFGETFVQVIDDVGENIEKHEGLFRQAELIFVDGPKDGEWEPLFLEKLESLKLGHQPLVVMDDIRVWNMIKIWREVRRPKLDLTSFGHWSGTGLIDWVA